VPRSVRHDGRTIPFELVRSDRRTLGLSVRADGSVVARAPRRTREADVLTWVAGHAAWILRKQREFAEREVTRTTFRYADGEPHLYLGREYRLTLEHGEREGVRLEGGRLVVTAKLAAQPAAPVAQPATEGPNGQLVLTTTEPTAECPSPTAESDHVKQLLDAWYLRRAKRELAARLQACWADPSGEETSPFNGRPLPTLRVKHMRSRWGSMSPKGAMSLRADLVRAPVECIDYVIVHELCHLVHPHHGRPFWAMVERLMPDWKHRRCRLQLLAP
jgi:predicted metal-dependent hydrolase